MQKFTVFSIVLSLSIILIIGDIVTHDYFSSNPDSQNAVDDLDVNVDGGLEDEISMDYDDVVSLTEEPELLESVVWDGMFSAAGFINPILKESIFSGMVFQFIEFSDQTDAYVYQWNLFDGEEFIGSIYEIKYPTVTGSFQGYLSLRERASAMYDFGEMNEVNNYGDSSFYFNHKTKTKTVHLVIRSGSDIYALEYAHKYHEQMKNFLDTL